MADEGWIKLYRKVRQSFVWTNSDQLKLWLLCLMKASHSGNDFLFNGKEIHVSSGEFVTGRDALTFEFNQGVTRDHQIVGRTLWRWIKLFESEQMLSIKSTTKYSVITVLHWDEYQSIDQQVSNTRPSTVQHLSTIKNAKNAENAKKKNSPKNHRTYSDDSQEFILASYLLERIKVNNPDVKEPDLQKWADGIRLMIERDKREPEKIRKMIDWSQSNDFWSGNVLSVVKLRKHFDQMATQANKEYKAHHRNPPTEHMNLDSVEDF